MFFCGERKTSRSQEIDDKRLQEGLGSSDRTGKLVKSEDIRVMHAHDGTGELVKSSASTHTVKEQFATEENCDIALFNANNKFNLATDEENIDFNIPGVPNSMVKRSHDVNVHNLIQKIENHPQRQALQSDLQHHRPFNPFSKESQDAIKAAGNTELCEIVDVEPKAQCKVCLSYRDVGIVCCTCGHFLRDGTAENKKYIKSVLDLFSIPNFYIRKGRPHGHRYGKKEGCKEYHTANQLQKKCIKRKYKNIHDRFIRDTWFRKTMLELGRTEEVIREMDRLANEDHTHIATEEELDVYRGNWWIRSNFVGSDTMPIRHRPDFKEALSTLHRFKKAEDIEIRNRSVNQDNSQSWVRISYGTVKHVVDSIQDNTEIPADPQEERVPQTSIKVVAARSKVKAKPQPRALVGTTTTIPMHERRWIDIEPTEQTLASYDLSKKEISILRHNQKLHREEDGAIQFYKIKFHLRNHHSQIQVWSDDRWKACLHAGGGSKRRYQYCSDDSGTIIYLRALQGHSGSNLIDPTLQDNVVIGSGIFHYIYHFGCAFNLHSIINNGLIPGAQDLSRRQTVFFLPIDPRDENHKDPEYIDFYVPRLARYVHSAWKRHQDAVFWVDIDLAISEGFTFYQTRSNAIILQ